MVNGTVRGLAMTEEIKEGDWISCPVDGGEAQGEVVGVIDDSYGVRPNGMNPGQTVLVPKGERVTKITPPDEG
jgi:hypothetical protein